METDHWHKMQAEDGVWITLDGLHMGVEAMTPGPPACCRSGS